MKLVTVIVCALVIGCTGLHADTTKKDETKITREKAFIISEAILLRSNLALQAQAMQETINKMENDVRAAEKERDVVLAEHNIKLDDLLKGMVAIDLKRCPGTPAICEIVRAPMIATVKK